MVAGNIFYVPWPDFSEWNNVKEQIFSPNIQDTITAYRTILMWKLKYDSIPAYIECTYSLLQVMVKEYEMTKTEQNSLLFDERDLQLSYSTALIRFVNHISSVSAYKGETLYLAAKTQNIPDWIINMRHDVAHGQNLPALEALHVAAELSLKWLLNNYWGHAESCQQKVLDESQVDLESGWLREINLDVQLFFKKFFDVWEFYQDARCKKVQVVPEAEREFILHLEELLSLNKVYFNNLENEWTIEIQNVVNAYNRMEENGELKSGHLCQLKSLKSLLLKFIKNTIKGNDQLKNSFVMSLFETTFLSEMSFNTQKWQPILRLTQEAHSFSFLLEMLFQMVGKGHKGACKWLSVLLPSIRHLKKQWTVFKILQKEKKNFNARQIKKKIRSNCQPTDPKLVIVLDIFKPPVISLEMMKNVLLNPEPFSVESIVEYLKLIKPPLMESTFDMIRDLVSLHVAGRGSEEPEEANDDKVFTVDDLDKVLENEESLVCEESTDSNGWARSSIDVNAWNKCPLGLLPFQTKVDCSLPGNLSWERKPSRKRSPIPILKHSVDMKKLRQF